MAILKSDPQKINKIVIEDNINDQPLVFKNDKEPMGNVIFNRELQELARKRLEKLNILNTDLNIEISRILPNKVIKLNKKLFI